MVCPESPTHLDRAVQRTGQTFFSFQTFHPDEDQTCLTAGGVGGVSSLVSQQSLVKAKQQIRAELKHLDRIWSDAP